MNEVVTTIVRFHDARRLSTLARALQSLHAQDGARVQPVVVLQRFSEEEIEDVRALVEREWFFDWHPPAVVTNYAVGEGPDDARTQLLNLGIQEHLALQNRYLGFLDHDDVLYTHAYRKLIKEILELGVTFAFGGIERANYVPLASHDFVYEMSRPFRGANKVDLLRENFCPIHSYLIDTTKIPAERLYFDDALTRLEDYDFLLRVAAPSPCSFNLLKQYIGMYMFPVDGSNSTPFGSSSSADLKKNEYWAMQRRILSSRRASYEVKFFASDF